MRTRWEDGGTSPLDEPANLTIRDYRSLRRGARAGGFAMLLAFVAVVAAAWNLVMGPDMLAGLGPIQEVKQKVLAAIGQPAPVESPQAQSQAPRPEPPQGPGAPQSVPAAPGGQPVAVHDSSAARVSMSSGR
jgi:hypothetical protein